MTEKSFTGLGLQVCPVCLKEHSETVLIDKRMKASLPQYSFTGWELCPLHESMREKYVILVEVSEEPTGENPVASAKRTGHVAFVKRDVWDGLFTIPMPKVMCFVQPDVIPSLQDRMPTADQTIALTGTTDADTQEDPQAAGQGGNGQEGSTSDAQGPSAGEGDAGGQGDGAPAGESEARRDD